MPWFFKHCTSAARLALEPPVEAAAGVEVVLELLDELLPHAASARVAVIAASAGISRRARPGVLLGDFTCRSFRRGGVGQPPLEEPPPVELLPVVRAPESLTEVATTVPLEFFTP
jgi:hypothetical protein